MSSPQSYTCYIRVIRRRAEVLFCPLMTRMVEGFVVGLDVSCMRGRDDVAGNSCFA